MRMRFVHLTTPDGICELLHMSISGKSLILHFILDSFFTIVNVFSIYVWLKIIKNHYLYNFKIQLKPNLLFSFFKSL